MATTIITKYGSGAPAASDVVRGELAVDTENGRLYTEDSGGSIIEIGLNPSGNVDVTGTVTIETGSGNTYPAASTSADNLVISDKTASTPVGITIFSDNASQGNIFFGDENDADNGRIVYDHNGNANTMSFYTNGSERVVVDSSGNVGIGTASPVSPLTTSIGAGSAGSLNNQIAMTHSGASNSYHIKTIRATANDEPAGLAFVENTTERMRIDSSGHLLVGTTDNEPYNNNTGNTDDNGIALSGGGWLASSRFEGVAAYFNRTNTPGDIVTINYNGATKGTIGSDGNILYIGSGEGTDAYLGFGNDIIRPVTSTGASRDAAIDLGYTGMRFRNLYLSNNISLTNASTSAFIQVSSDVFQFGTSSSDPIDFYAGNALAMRLDASGNLLVGDSSNVAAGSEAVEIRGDAGYIKTGRNTTATANHHLFYNPNGIVGSITTSGSSTAYNTSSDQRLKSNIVDAPSASDDIDAIQVRSFDWKVDGSHQKYGMVAQELVAVAPEAVSQPEDPEEMMGVDYSKLVPMMLKEIQQLRARVAQLEGAN